jgi:hypothetical protein
MSQTIIYAEGEIQVAEVGTIDVNKIQRFWHIRFKFFFPFLFTSTFFYSTFGKNSHTKKRTVGLVMGGFTLIAISRQGSNTLLSALCFSVTEGHAT